MTDEERLAAIDLARTIYANDDVEIDDNAEAHTNDDGGVWVSAWVYLRPGAVGGCDVGED